VEELRVTTAEAWRVPVLGVALFTLANLNPGRDHQAADDPAGDIAGVERARGRRRGADLRVDPPF
jgi:hypothetical protein